MPKTKKRDLRAQWGAEMEKSLVGKRVVETRYLKDAEMKALGWEESVPVIIFDDGSMLFPSRDDEGNGGGALFGQGPKNEELTFPVIRSYLL